MNTLHSTSAWPPYLFALLTLVCLLLYQRSSVVPTSMTVAPAIKRTPVWIVSHGSPNSLFEPNHPAFLHWRKLGKEIRAQKPKGIVIVSAHWQASASKAAQASSSGSNDKRPFVEINVNKDNPIVYDFYGFPKHYYQETFASVNPHDLSSLVAGTLRQNNVDVAAADRGLDHGVWVPLKGVFGDSTDIPVVQVSLPVEANLETEVKQCWQLGTALRSLRQQDIVVIGSGQAVHNLRDYFNNRQNPNPTSDYGIKFSEALQDVMTYNVRPNGDVDPTLSKREQLFERLVTSRDYLQSHPTSEHFLPFIVAAAAASDDEVGKLTFEYRNGPLSWDMYQFGEVTV